MFDSSGIPEEGVCMVFSRAIGLKVDMQCDFSLTAQAIKLYTEESPGLQWPNSGKAANEVPHRTCWVMAQ